MMKKLKNSYLSYFLMYNFYYLSWALFSVLISVYLMDKGYSASNVSIVVSISFLTSMLAQPSIGMLCDRYGMRKINIILFILSGIGGILFMLAGNLFWITVGYSFVLTLINGANPIMEKMATASPYSYGSIRIWGTLGYAMGSQFAGLIYDYVFPEAIYLAFLITITLSIIGTIFVEPKKVIADKNEKSSVMDVLKNKKYLYYLVISALFFGMTNAAHTYVPAMLNHDGLEVGFVSNILSIAVVCEAPLVLFSHKFMDKMANKTLMIIAYGLVLIQFICYGLDMMVPLKIVITFLAKHPGGMLFIMINLKVVSTLVEPQYQMTALAFVQTIKNLSSIAFQNVAGYIIDTSSYANLFMIYSVLLFIGLLLVIKFKVPSGKDLNLFH